MIRPHQLSDTSTFVGQTCALCKQEFAAGDAIIICPEDGSRHHVHCWEANNNHCTAYGCKGQGAVGDPSSALPTAQPIRRRPPSRPTIITRSEASSETSGSTPPRRPAVRPIVSSPGSKVGTLPAGSFGCVKACLIVALILAIILVALACAAAWFLTDYVSQIPLSGSPVSTLTIFWTNFTAFPLTSMLAI